MARCGSAPSAGLSLRRQRQRGAAAPPADQLRGEEFPFCFGVSVRLEESIERPDTRLIFAEAHIGAIAIEYVGCGIGSGKPASPGYPRMNSPGLIGCPCPGRALVLAHGLRFYADCLFIRQGASMLYYISRAGPKSLTMLGFATSFIALTNVNTA